MAQIIDATADKPKKGEAYFVDTNVWYWFTYVSSRKMALPNHPQDYQLETYPKFIEDALTIGSKLCHSALTLAELANIIEMTELEIYRAKIDNQHFEKKEFRKIAASRKKVLNEIEVAWNTINSMSSCVDAKLDKKFANDSNNVMREGLVDPFDAFLIQTMRHNKIDYIITDDNDFCEIENQIVVTANKRSLKYAH